MWLAIENCPFRELRVAREGGLEITNDPSANGEEMMLNRAIDRLRVARAQHVENVTVPLRELNQIALQHRHRELATLRARAPG